MIIIDRYGILDFLGGSIWYAFLLYLGALLERWNVKRKAEKEAAQKWYETQDREPKL